jgi:hypothetical protein
MSDPKTRAAPQFSEWQPQNSEALAKEDKAGQGQFGEEACRNGCFRAHGSGDESPTVR